MTERDSLHLKSTFGPNQSRPNSQRQMMNKRSPRVVNRSIKLRDDIASGFRSSADRSSALGASGGYKFGTIMNYKKTEGINEQAGAGSFRKWTGMPQTTRASKKLAIPGLNVNKAKMVADHRKKTVLPIEMQNSFESTLGQTEHPSRNISQTAWNKIRLVEMKKKDRLNFNM